MKFESAAAKIEAHGKGRPNRGDRSVGWDDVQGHLERMTKRVARGRSAIGNGHRPSWASVSRSVKAHDYAAKRQRD